MDKFDVNAIIIIAILLILSLAGYATAIMLAAISDKYKRYKDKKRKAKTINLFI